MSTSGFSPPTRQWLAGLLLLAGASAAQTPTPRALAHARTLETCKLPNELIRQKPASTTKSQREQLARAGQAVESWATTYLKPEATAPSGKEQYFRALVMAGRYYLWANQYDATLRLYKQALPLFPRCQRTPQETRPVVASFCSEMSDGIMFISLAKGYQYPPEYADDYELHIEINQMRFDKAAYQAYEKKLAAASSPAELQRVRDEEKVRMTKALAQEQAEERQAATQDSLARSQGRILNPELLRATDPERDQL